MSARPPYVALRWRRPAVFFAPLGVAVAASVPGGAVAARLPDAAGLGGALSLSLGVILVAALLLCARRDRTMPILLATTLSVTHAALFVGVLVALGVPSLGERVRDLCAQAGAHAVAHQALAAVLSVYLGAFVLLTLLAGIGITALRYLAMTRRAA